MKLGVLEIQDQPNSKSCDPKVVYHLSTFVIGDLIDHFRVDNHSGICNQVGNELTNRHTFVRHGKPPLLIESNLPASKFNRQSILVNLFNPPVEKLIQHLESAAQDIVRLLFQQQLAIFSVWNNDSEIRVHLCSSVVYFFINLYSILSARACKLASMMLSLAPTVPQSSLPSVDSISTRVLAAVPVAESRMRTL